MKTYREFINEVATQSTIIPKYDLGTPQTQLSKPVTRPSLMQQAQDLRAMRLRAIERQGGREDEAQRLRAQLSSAEQKASDNRAAELAKLRQGERDQTIARSQNPVRNGTNSNTANTSNTANNNNNTRRDDTRIAQANTVGGANVRRGYLPKPTGGIQGYTGIDRDKLNQAMDAETNRLNDLNKRRTDMETRNQQNPPPPKPSKPPTPTQTQTQTPSTTQEPKGKSWWQQKWEEIFGNSETKTQEPKTQEPKTQEPKTQEPKTQEPSNQPTQPTQPTQPSGSLTAEQQKRMDDAWNNRGTVGKQVEEYYNTLSDEDKRRFREYSKSKGYNWQFY